MYSLAQVLSSEFARTWHEAVAIVQEAASQLQPGLALPGPEDLIIDDAGVLTFGFGSESSDSPVAALSGLLDRLLTGVEAPQSLLDLVSQNIGPNPSHGTVASFSQALAFFERPNRGNDIRAVAARLGGAVLPKSSSEQEFERLREKVAHAPEPEQKKKKERKKQPRLSKVQQALVVAAVCLLVFGTLTYRSGLHRNVGSLTAGVEGAVQGVLSAGLDRLGVSKAASAAPAPEETLKDEPLEKGRESGPARTSGTQRAANKTSTGSGTTPNFGRPATTERASDNSTPAVKPELPAGKRAPAAPANGELTTVAPGAAAVPPAFTARVTPGDGAVFSDDHPEVQAPVLVRPQLPKEPAPGDDTGIFDMLVDENGDVISVKLISPRRRFHDRMLVAAAKAWKFRPAQLNGYPVKYRIQIPIILKGMP